MPPKGQRDTKKEKPRDAKGTLLRIWRYVTRFRVLMLLIALMCIASNLLALVGPSLAGQAIDEASAGAGKVNFERVWHYARLMLLFYVSSSVLTLLINFLMMKVGRNIARQMRSDVFYKLMKLPVNYFDRNAAGDIISRVSYDIDVLSTSISTDIVQIMTSLITVAGSLFMMILISPLLSLMVLVTIPLSIFIPATWGKRPVLFLPGARQPTVK